MPHFTLPLDPDGLIVQAVFGLNGPQTTSLVQAGQAIPSPIQVRALLDSGSDVSAIAPRVVQQLGVISLISGSSVTASGKLAVNLYRVSLTIAGTGGRAGPVLAISDLLVSELATPLPNLEALIGLDVLRECLLIFDGPAQRFTLGF